MAGGHVLVVDDEAGVRTTLAEILKDEGLQVTLANDAAGALKAVARSLPDLILLDVWMPGRDGLDLLPELREKAPGTLVVMISGHGTIDTAVRATKLGAFDFVEKPLSLEKILVTVRNGLKQRRLEERARLLTEQLAGEDALIGACKPIARLREQIQRAAPSDARVLIFGENGTGKELVARMLHRQSNRHDEAFVDVNCAAIPEELIESELFGHVRGAFTGATENKKGKFALADEGTLLLDEVADMSLKVQAKVLRVLQEQTFEPVGGRLQQRADVRVVAATNKDLETEIAAGRFREDLYFRLNVIPLSVPPLRERGDDVLLLADHFAGTFARRHGRAPLAFSPAAGRALLGYRWPGNVRELRNLVERLAILLDTDTVAREDLPQAVRSDAPAAPAAGGVPAEAGGSLKEARDRFEREFIQARITEAGGNMSRAAEIMGLDRSSLYRKLRQHGLRDDTAGD